MLALPHDAVTAMSKYGYHYGLDGYMGGLQKAIDLEAGLFISTKGKKSVIGEMVNDGSYDDIFCLLLKIKEEHECHNHMDSHD